MTIESGDDLMTDAEMPQGRRAQNRLIRTREFLGTALRIVTAEGFDALTMQRLADECGSAIGAVYRYFPSKSALMVEVQREAIDRLMTSYSVVEDRGEQRIAELGLDDETAAMTRLMLMGRWFVACHDSYTEEFRLLHMVFSESRPVVPPEEAVRVLPSVIRLLDRARGLLEGCVELGVLDRRADPMQRTVLWAASVAASLQLGSLDVYDADLFDGVQLAYTLIEDLYLAWGADPELLAIGTAHVEDMAADGPYAPPNLRSAS